MKRIKTDLEIKSRIKEILTSREMKSKDLYEMVNISQEGISKIINNKYKSIDFKMVVLIANALDCSISDVFNTGCIKDENNKIILELMKPILIIDLKNFFNENEINFFGNLFNNGIIELYSQFSTKLSETNKNTQFLSYIVLDSYNTNRDLALNYNIEITSLVDKINGFTEIECLSIIYNFLKGDKYDIS